MATRSRIVQGRLSCQIYSYTETSWLRYTRYIRTGAPRVTSNHCLNSVFELFCVPNLLEMTGGGEQLVNIQYLAEGLEKCSYEMSAVVGKYIFGLAEAVPQLTYKLLRVLRS